jgi:hypothetical protein
MLHSAQVTQCARSESVLVSSAICPNHGQVFAPDDNAANQIEVPRASNLTVRGN